MCTAGSYYYWLRRLELQLMDTDTLNFGGSGPHPPGGWGGGVLGGFVLRGEQ